MLTKIAPSSRRRYLYPEQAKFGQVLPKNEVYGHAKSSRAVRQRFVDEAAEIVWRHKLAPETLRKHAGWSSMSAVSSAVPAPLSHLLN
jgi:hypothetical protein